MSFRKKTTTPIHKLASIVFFARLKNGILNKIFELIEYWYIKVKNAEVIVAMPAPIKLSLGIRSRHKPIFRIMPIRFSFKLTI